MIASAPPGALAESKPSAGKASAPKSAPGKSSEPSAEPAQLVMPDANKLTLLIQSHMAALSSAIQTDNFSVLHALGSAEFQKINPPDKLRQTFRTFKANGLDLTPVILFSPIMSEAPAFDSTGKLHLKGHYNTEPQKVAFDMLFAHADGAWKLFGISAAVLPATPDK